MAGMTRRAALLLLLAGVAMLGATAADAAVVVGKISRIVGDGRATSEGVVRVLAADAPIHQDEVVTTGVAARLEVTLNDGTVLTVGEKARIAIDSFVYHPAGTVNRLKVAVAGPFRIASALNKRVEVRFVSGKLSKRPGADVAVTTPVATIGVRGTDFWGGPIDGHFGVFLIVGKVSVVNAAGRALLAESGEGTNIAGIGAPPGALTLWPADKVARALATVNFP